MAQREDAATVDLKVRMKEPLRARIEAAADARGISMNAEAVQRLERSFDRSDLLSEALTLALGPQSAGIVIMMANAMSKAGQMAATMANPGDMIRARQSWFDDPYAFNQAVAAVNHVLEGLRPSGSTEPTAAAKAIDGLGHDFGSRIGEGCANAEMDSALGNYPMASFQASGEQYARLLGPLVERLRPIQENDNAR